MNAYIIGFLLLASVPANCTEKTTNRINITTKYRGSLGFVSAAALIGVPLFLQCRQLKKQPLEPRARFYITRPLVSTEETSAYRAFMADAKKRMPMHPGLSYKGGYTTGFYVNSDLSSGEPLTIELKAAVYTVKVFDHLKKTMHPSEPKQVGNALWGMKQIIPIQTEISPQVEVDSLPTSDTTIGPLWANQTPTNNAQYCTQPPYLRPRITFRPLSPDEFYVHPLQKCHVAFHYVPSYRPLGAEPTVGGLLSAHIKCHEVINWEASNKVTLDVTVEANIDKPDEVK